MNMFEFGTRRERDGEMERRIGSEKMVERREGERNREEDIAWVEK